MFIKKDIVISKQKDIVIRQAQLDLFAPAGVILPKNKNNTNIKNLNKFDIKHNDKSYENIKNIVLSSDAKLEKSKK